MPIEIREVVIKAQLEKPLVQNKNQGAISEERLHQLKEEIMTTLLERIEEKFWKIFNR